MDEYTNHVAKVQQIEGKRPSSQSLTVSVIPQKDLSPKLTPKQIEIVRASAGVRLFIENGTTVSIDKNVKYALDQMIMSLYYYKGYSIPGATSQERSAYIDQLSTVLIGELSAIYKAITRIDLQLIFERGRRGEYGEFKIISIETFVIWVKAYLQERSIASIEQQAYTNAKQLGIPTEPTPTEWKNKMINMAKSCYEDVEKGRLPRDYGNVLFRYLREIGVLLFTDQEINSYMERAKAQLISENNPADSKTLADRIDRRNFVALIVNESKNKQVVTRARLLALMNYFETSFSIEDVINDINVNTTD